MNLRGMEWAVGLGLADDTVAEFDHLVVVNADDRVGAMVAALQEAGPEWIILTVKRLN
ncbi:hypothetical protein ACO03V_14465 [Microbacterium sp. HMH0099]|uniref:hypothetical protein n=1 Tax=Microbacterium sp. HMH0099 TaxID=3414026 RepID=UPI003BF71CBA